MSSNGHRPQVLFNVFNSLINPCHAVSSTPPICLAVFGQLEPISLSILEEVVKHVWPANCHLDSIPSRIFKAVFNTVGSSLRFLINTSLSSGCVPAAFKHAVVQPLLKKTNLDPAALASFRPISYPSCPRSWRE